VANASFIFLICILLYISNFIKNAYQQQYTNHSLTNHAQDCTRLTFVDTPVTTVTQWKTCWLPCTLRAPVRYALHDRTLW